MRIHTILVLAALSLSLPSLSHAQTLIVPGQPPGIVGEGFFSGDLYGTTQCDAEGCFYAQVEPDGELAFGRIWGNSAGATKWDCRSRGACEFIWQPALLPPVEFGKHLGKPGYGPPSQTFGCRTLQDC